MTTRAVDRSARREPATAPGLALVETKLQPPWTRPGLVERTTTVKRLLDSDTPIVAVVAPPGYGKTTLLSQWVALNPRSTAWVSLDERDNDPGVIVSYLAEALDRIDPIDPEIRRSLRSVAIVDPAAVVHLLAVVVSSMREPFALVIDHLEVIESERSRDAIAELALNLPHGSQLALASRTALPLPMGRLRAERLVIDITADDLAMDEVEASELLARAEVTLTEEDLTDLVQRTEGWPVGLYLAALAGAGRPGAGMAFHGDDRLMADYLRSEVLACLSPEAAVLLTRTSVLDQLSGPLCDAVLGTTGSQQVLESIEASNLLLVPVDRRREWYRCHHLLRELLRTELVRSEPELVPALHERAAQWFEATGRTDLAIDHAQAGGDADRAALLFAGIAQLTFAAGRLDTVLRWLGWFDANGSIERYPHVAMLGALSSSMLGQATNAERWADAAASASFDGLLPDGSTVESWIAVLETVLYRRGLAQVRADAQRALDTLSPRSPFRGPTLYLQATAFLLEGDSADVEPILTRAAEVSFRDGAMPSAAPALAERAVLALERHDWAAAESLAKDAVAIVDGGHLQGYLTSTLVYAVAARTAAHRGDVKEAREHVARASRLRPLCGPAAPFSVRYLLQLAHAYLELADPAGARAVLRQIRDILQARPNLGVVPQQADDLQRMLDTIRIGSVGASSLTAAELRLLPLLATHLSYRDIGERLHVSRNTVKSQAVSLFRKVGVSSRSEAVAVAEQTGLLGR